MINIKPKKIENSGEFVGTPFTKIVSPGIPEDKAIIPKINIANPIIMNGANRHPKNKYILFPLNKTIMDDSQNR